MQDILDGAEDHTLGAGVGAAPVGEDAGNGAAVGLDLLLDLAGIFDDHVLPAHLARLFGKALQHSLYNLLAVGNGYRFSCALARYFDYVLHGFLDSAHDMATLPLSPVLIRMDSSTGQTKILPSPKLPVRLTIVIIATTAGTNSSSTIIEIILLGTYFMLF